MIEQNNEKSVWEMQLLSRISNFQNHTKIDILTISCITALRWTPQDLTDDQST